MNNDNEISTVGEGSVYFDADADGVRESVSWIGAEDGWLARDVNGNGLIGDASELFGSDTVSGFDALSALDDNADGKIDAQDAAYDELVVWRDANQDGAAQAGELFSVANDLFIREIPLTAASGTQHAYAEAAIGQVRVENMLRHGRCGQIPLTG